MIKWNRTKTKTPKSSTNQILVDFGDDYRILYYYEDSWSDTTGRPRSKFTSPIRWFSLEGE